MSWKLSIIVMSAFFLLVACNGQGEKKSEPQDTHAKESATEKTYYYTCPMEQHKHISSDKPGNCSECGMKLVAAVETDSVSAEYYGCPMPSHRKIRHEKAGKCEECNMDLKPMQLVTK